MENNGSFNSLDEVLNQIKTVERGFLIKKRRNIKDIEKFIKKPLIVTDKFSALYEQKGLIYEENLCEIGTKELIDKSKIKSFMPENTIITIDEIASKFSTGIIETLHQYATLFLLAKLCYRKNLFNDAAFLFEDKPLNFEDLTVLHLGYSNFINMPKGALNIIKTAKEKGLTEKDLREFSIFNYDEATIKAIKSGYTEPQSTNLYISTQ